MRKLLPRACAKIKLGAQGQQTAWKAGQGSVKSKAPLLQMHSPFHDALKFKRFPDCLTFPAALAREPQLSPACASRCYR